MSNGHLRKPAASRGSQIYLGCFPQLRLEMEVTSELSSDSHIPRPACWEAPRGLPPKTNQVPAVSLGPTCLPHLIWKTVGVPTLSPCFCPWPSPTTALISAQLEDSFAHVSHKVSWVTHLSLKPSRVPVPPLLA